MNVLTQMYAQLAVALTADPHLLLAAAVATFDPYWDECDDEIDYDTDPLFIALQVTRGAFPEIYAEAIEKLRTGATYQDMDRLICKAITAKGIPLDDLDLIGWGVPLISVGVDLDDPEFYTAHPHILPALAPFGMVIPDAQTDSLDVPRSIYKVGYAIAADLDTQTDSMLQQLGWLVGWLFGCTGNSLCDLTDESLAEIQPLSWSSDDIAFAKELIEEADGIVRDAMVGLEYLQTNPDLMATLERNIAILNHVLQEKGKLDEYHPRLDWQHTDDSVDRTTVTDALVLQLRRDAA